VSSLHCYARTNSHIRDIIQNSELTNTELATKYGVNKKQFLNREIEITQKTLSIGLFNT